MCYINWILLFKNSLITRSRTPWKMQEIQDEKFLWARTIIPVQNLKIPIKSESAASVTSSCFVRLWKQMKEFYVKSFYFLLDFLCSCGREDVKLGQIEEYFSYFFLLCSVDEQEFIRSWLYWNFYHVIS